MRSILVDEFVQEAFLEERRKGPRRAADGTTSGHPGEFCVQHAHTSQALDDLVVLGVGRERDVSWLMRQFRWFLVVSGTVLMFLCGAYLTLSYQFRLEMHERDAVRQNIINSVAKISELVATHDVRLAGDDKKLSELTAYTNVQNSRDAIRAFQSSRLDLIEKQMTILGELIVHFHPTKQPASSK